MQKDAASELLQSARETLKVIKDNYDTGVIGMYDLFETQSVYQGASNSLTEAKFTYLITRAKYLKSINI